LIKGRNDKIQYVCNKKNIGLCASVNNGFRLAIDKNADWVLIMNPDGTFSNNAIDIYRNFIRNQFTDDVAIIAPIFNSDRRPKKAKPGYRNIKYADMSGCLYNVSILKEIGLYDKNTYFYGLDVEYCLRVIRNGYKIIECSEAVLNHHPAQTYHVKLFGKTVFKCGKDTPNRYYYQFRSAYYIYKKYHDFYNFAFHIYKFLKVIFFFDNKKEYIKMIRSGILDAKSGYYGEKL